MTDKRTLKRLEKVAERTQRRAQELAGGVKVIEVYCEGKLIEVMRLDGLTDDALQQTLVVLNDTTLDDELEDLRRQTDELIAQYPGV